MLKAGACRSTGGGPARPASASTAVTAPASTHPPRPHRTGRPVTTPAAPPNYRSAARLRHDSSRRGSGMAQVHHIFLLDQLGLSHPTLLQALREQAARLMTKRYDSRGPGRKPTDYERILLSGEGAWSRADHSLRCPLPLGRAVTRPPGVRGTRLEFPAVVFRGFLLPSFRWLAVRSRSSALAVPFHGGGHGNNGDQASEVAGAAGHCGSCRGGSGGWRRHRGPRIRAGRACRRRQRRHQRQLST
jgi:hypothetical protein